MRRNICAHVVPLSVLLTSPALADFTWSDTFNAGPSSHWRNESGNWSASGGVYNAANWANYPNARSSVPFALDATEVSVDFVNLQDGGIWVRSAESSSSVGRSGVLLVTGGATLTGTTLYWHIVPPGGGYGASLEHSVPFINSGSTDATIRVTVQGNVYNAYINDSTTPATTITTDLFPAGEVALYDYSPSQGVDAVRMSSPTVIPGDANVDGRVSFDDLLIIAQQYGTTTGATWLDGDFDSSGSVEFDDLLTLAQHYGEPIPAALSVPVLIEQDWTRARSMVPEPVSVGAMIAAGLLVRRRR
jgi:hypothetical protein